jgi:hypothetical protein
MRSFSLFLLLCGLVFPGRETVTGQSPVKEMSAVRGYKNWYIGNFRCGVFVPPDYHPDRSYPLVIYLHGYTDTTTWDLEWYHERMTSKDPCIVLTPKCPKEEGDGWGNSFFPGVSPMMEKTYKMLEMAERAFNLDRDRYYVYGTSMGGFGAFAAIQHKPELFAAGYVLCGNGNIELAPVLAGIPFWMFHGSDDSIVPVQPTRELYRAVLKSGGKQIRYTEYEGAGHNVWKYVRNETTLHTWLLAQRKGSVHGKPGAVNGFTGELSDKKILLQWEVPPDTTPPSDDNIWYCKIYRNGRVIKEVYNDQHSFTDLWLLLNSTYQYQISAVNYYFKESELSSPLSFTFTE